MVKLWCSAFDRIRVPARPAPHVHRRVPDVRRRTRPSASTIGGGYTGHDHLASCRGSRGSASLPTPAAERLGPIISRVAHSETKPSRQSFFRTLPRQHCYPHLPLPLILKEKA